jgi:hypothetical protein
MLSCLHPKTLLQKLNKLLLKSQKHVLPLLDSETYEWH